jgi:hypothetical protein
MKVFCGQVFRYAIGEGRAERDITADIKAQLKTKKVAHYPHLAANKREIGNILTAIDNYNGYP